MQLQQTVKEALSASCRDFCRLVEEATSLLQSENGRIGNLDVLGRLVKLEPVGEALVMSDLHGDLESLIDILEDSQFFQKMSQDPNAVAVFLGDYGDRGPYSAEVYHVVLRLKLQFPRQVVLLRGNHEGPEDLMASPHDLPWQFEARFGAEWEEAYTRIRELFNCLYNAVIVDDRYLMVHGGPPPQAKTLEDLAYAHIKHPKESLLEDLLWSDPTDIISETCASPRGAGKLFGQKVTDAAIKTFGVKIIVRGHEPCMEGYKVGHKGKILTLFSRRGAPYFNEHGAYLMVDLSQKMQNAFELTQFTHKI
ncbi:MAG: serine/threonine protein phosphatase [Candidatus Bathyarchaeota archaeon]|nr:serine/threonine protein phosphatase [Candidatus Bathyarchaeota archaeon]